MCRELGPVGVPKMSSALVFAHVRAGRPEDLDHERGEDRHQDQQDDEDHGGQRQLVLTEPPPEELPRRAGSDRGGVDLG